MQAAPQAFAPTADVVLIGGGHSHAQVVLSYAMRRPGHYRITMIGETPDSTYSGMMPGVLGGRYPLTEAQIDLGHLCEAAGVRFVQGRVTGLDPVAGEVEVNGTVRISFDLASVNIGSVPRTSAFPGAEFIKTLAIKPMPRLLAELAATEALLQSTASGTLEDLVIVGAGAAGCEVAAGLAARLRRSGLSHRLRVTLIEQGGDILKGYPARLRRHTHAALQRLGVHVLTATSVRHGEAQDRLRLSSGETLHCRMLIWATGAVAPPLIQNTPLAADAAGFALVGPTLQSVSHPNILVSGDSAASFWPDGTPVPKAGVYAVRMAPIITENIERWLAGRELVVFRPQRRFLSLLAMGGDYAVGSWGSVSFSGRSVARLKDTIDRRWIRRYQQPRKDIRVASFLETGDLSEPPCGGCGAKLPLSALDVLPPGLRGEDASTVTMGGGDRPGALFIQSTDYLKQVGGDLYRFGALAAVHALGDLWAMGVPGHSAQVLATVPYGTAKLMTRDLSLLMQGVRDKLTECGTELLGGHSQSAAEGGIGLTVQSFAPAASPLWRKDGLRPGDVLILTKPLGSGLIFAAEMRRAVPTALVTEAVHTMLRPQMDLLPALHSAGVRASTDVTGFGFAAHLAEMCRLSSVGARIDLAALPIYRGATDALELGIRASLHHQNRADFTALTSGLTGADALRAEVLFDPQTAGGLLVGCPRESADAALAAMHAAGFPAAAIVGDIDGSDLTSGIRILPGISQ